MQGHPQITYVVNYGMHSDFMCSEWIKSGEIYNDL